MKKHIIFALLIQALLFSGCRSTHLTEQQRFEKSVMKELPFSVDTISWLTSGDLPTFKFANAAYTDASPDAEIRNDGDYSVCNMFDMQPPSHQTEESIWRNVVVSRKNRRVVCIDRYEAPSNTSYAEWKDTFEMRSRQWNYDLALKETLERIFERDQYDRMLWSQAVKSHPDDTERNDHLARRAHQTDSLNLALVGHILSEKGFPRKERVGELGSQAVWLVFQHANLDYQKRFLPQLEDAVGRGDIAPLYLALLQDRIDVREGRPQRYGTQIDSNGHLAPLLDASRVNQWRQEVGLPGDIIISSSQRYE